MIAVIFYFMLLVSRILIPVEKNNEINEFLIKKTIQSLFANSVIVYFYV